MFHYCNNNVYFVLYVNKLFYLTSYTENLMKINLVYYLIKIICINKFKVKYLLSNRICFSELIDDTNIIYQKVPISNELIPQKS